MNNFEKNTKLFYEEINHNCDPDILLKLAKEGIFLYEPLLKYNKIKKYEYVVDISILSRQYFMIYKQYHRLFLRY